MKSCALMSLFLFCAFLALIGLAVVTHEQSPVTLAQRQADLAYRQARDAQDLAEREAAVAWWQQFRQDMTPVAWLVVIAVGVALAGGAAGGVGILLADLIFAVRKRSALVYPDARGLLPADYERLRRGDYDGHVLTALAGHHAAQLEAARQPRLPDDLRTYAPRYIEGKAAPRIIGGPEPRPELGAPASPVSPVAVPTFADLLRLGQVGQGRALLLGYTLDGTPVKGDMDSLFSFAVAGLQGAGKTTTERFLLGQVALQGGRFAVIDPHRDVPGGQSLAGTLAPLSGAFLLPPAADDGEIYQVIEWVSEEIDRRERGDTGPVIVLAVDEWTDLARRPCAEDLQALARRVSTTGRKLGIYAALSGQGWTKESAGEVRDYLTAAFVHKLRPQVARLLAPGVGNEVWTLAPGQAILDRTTGPRLTVTIPNTTGQDLAAVAGLLPAPAGDVTSPRPRPPSFLAAAYPMAHGTDSDGLGRSDGGNEPQNGPEEAPGTDRPRPPATDRPSLRVLMPQSLLDKARAVGVELSESDWADLAALDAGQTPQAIAARETGTTEGRPYRRRRDELMRLAEMIRTWPEDPARAADG